MKSISVLFFLFFLIISLKLEANSLAGISVTPTRLILSDQKRSAAITLRNTSDLNISYRLKFVEMGFDSYGELMKLSATQQPDGFKSLSPHVRFSPRQVKLAAGSSQVIRVMVKRNPTLLDAEYRSHLEILVLPEVLDNQFLNEDVSDVEEKVLPTVVTSLGVTLPVVWRKGVLDASGNIDNVVFIKESEGEIRAVSLDVGRSGARSVFGDLYVYLKAKDRSKRLIASLKDYGLYHPYNNENIVFPVNSLHESDLDSAEGIWVEFVNDESAIGPKNIFNKKVDWKTKGLH